MTGDASALRQAVLENPADDAPRLVYADWLDDHGRPDHAEFIRVQVAGAYAPCPHTWVPPRTSCTDPECRGCRQFRDRELALRAAPGFADWAWDGWVPPTTREIYVRGFVEMVFVVADQFVGAAGRLFALQPITAVRLTGRMPHLSRSAELSGAVWFRAPVGRAAIASLPEPIFDLLAAPPLRAVRRGQPFYRVYPGHDDANRALSEACVRFGRAAAGLK